MAGPATGFAAVLAAAGGRLVKFAQAGDEIATTQRILFRHHDCLQHEHGIVQVAVGGGDSVLGAGRVIE